MRMSYILLDTQRESVEKEFNCWLEALTNHFDGEIIVSYLFANDPIHLVSR